MREVSARPRTCSGMIAYRKPGRFTSDAWCGSRSGRRCLTCVWAYRRAIPNSGRPRGERDGRRDTLLERRACLRASHSSRSVVPASRAHASGGQSVRDHEARICLWRQNAVSAARLIGCGILSGLQRSPHDGDDGPEDDRRAISRVCPPGGDYRSDEGRGHVNRSHRIVREAELRKGKGRITPVGARAEQAAAVDRNGDGSEPPDPLRAGHAAECVRDQAHHGEARGDRSHSTIHARDRVCCCSPLPVCSPAESARTISRRPVLRLVALRAPVDYGAARW